MKLVTIFQQREPDYLLTIAGEAMPVDDMVKVATFETDLSVEHRSTSVGDFAVVDGQAGVCS